MKRFQATRARVVIAAATLSTIVWAGAANAQEDPPGLHHQWGVTYTIRAGSAGGDYGEFLEKGTAWDMDIFKQKGDWRYGVGLMFDSMGWKPPYEDEQEWAHFETFGYASRIFRNGERIRPYVQGRFAIVRVHPRSELFLKEPVEDLDPGESPTDAVNGIGLSVIPGFEFDLSKNFALDLSAYLNWYITEKYSLQDYEGNRPLGDQPDPSTGTEWGLRTGVTWRPSSFDPPPKRTSPPDSTLPSEDEYKDAWGVTKSWGWASAEVLAINFGASMFNEYVRQANFNQISPRSFWHNLEEGFDFDDNKFKTNQYVHPFNGSTYFNSGRANGLGYWSSCVTTVAGAFIWESAGETHPMSYNDMISTGIGGMAFGETMYRLSSEILDNTATGGGRTWREIGAFLVDPVRGFNRFLSGQASRVQGNPASPYDRRPPHYFTSLGAGIRITGSGESIKDSTETRPVIDLYVNSGSPWDNARRKPFDHFDVGVQFNGDDKNTLTRLQIRGDLFSKAFDHQGGPKHGVAFVQYFDYVNNNAFEFGAQSFGGAFYSRFRPSAKYGIQTRVDLLASILAAVNTEYSYVVVTPDQERDREYDYGPGAGFSFEAALSRMQHRVIMVGYRAQWINVSNGSIYVPAGNPGTSANHYLQSGIVKLNIPVRDAMAVGLDFSVYSRQSTFSNPNYVDTHQRVPQARLYLAFNTSR